MMNPWRNLVGVGVMLAAACSAEVPIGDGKTQNALGGDGEPPYRDGTCDVGLTNCGTICSRACGANDGGAPDAHSDSSSVDSGGDGGRTATDGSTMVAEAGDGSTSYFHLFVAAQQFNTYESQYIHSALHDDTTGNTWCVVAPGNTVPIQRGGFLEHMASDIETTHSYTYEYWFDSDPTPLCNGQPMTYYVHSFGPVSGDVHITITPNDPYNH